MLLNGAVLAGDPASLFCSYWVADSGFVQKAEKGREEQELGEGKREGGRL